MLYTPPLYTYLHDSRRPHTTCSRSLRRCRTPWRGVAPVLSGQPLRLTFTPRETLRGMRDHNRPGEYSRLIIRLLGPVSRIARITRLNAFDLCISIENLGRSEEHTSELQSLMRISYAVFSLNKTNTNINQNNP